jgi:hypothetical protein
MRTVEDFVRESKERGRTREEVRGIALSTQWANRIPEVLKEYDRQKTRSAA